LYRTVGKQYGQTKALLFHNYKEICQDLYDYNQPLS